MKVSPAFDRRCIPSPPQRGCRVGDPGAGCVAPSSNTPGILGRRALPAGRLTGLGARRDFHHGLLDPDLAESYADMFSGVKNSSGEGQGRAGVTGFNGTENSSFGKRSVLMMSTNAERSSAGLYTRGAESDAGQVDRQERPEC